MSQPVFIIGAARSGTKYLRDILALASNAAKVPYDINYVWRYGSENHADDSLPLSLLSSRKRAFIRAQVYRLSKASPEDETIVFEKTVGNSLRVPFVRGVFPEARFIHLVRDGRAVTESAMRQWREPVSWSRLLEKIRGLPLENIGYAAWFVRNYMSGRLAGRGGGRVWGPRYPGIQGDLADGLALSEICARQWRECVEAAIEALSAVPEDRHMTIRYDALVSGTEELGKVARFCGLSDIDLLLSEHSRRVRTRADDKWRYALSEHHKERMLPIVQPLLSSLGYSSSGVVA